MNDEVLDARGLECSGVPIVGVPCGERNIPHRLLGCVDDAMSRMEGFRGEEGWGLRKKHGTGWLPSFFSKM